MAYRDLREFVNVLQTKGLLREIKKEVDWCLEITEITDRVCKGGNWALLFKNVRGYKDTPVLINTFGSLERMKLALGVSDLSEITERINDFIQFKWSGSIAEKFRSLLKLWDISSISPKVMKSGVCKERIIKDNCSFFKFPILKCWPEDGGRFITLPLVITKDPETGTRNVGMYRMQIFDDKTACIHWHPHKDGARHYLKACERGERLEVAVALGGDPATIYAATAPLPEGIDEFLFAGFLRKEGVELVLCETVNLEVPAWAEIVFEGYIEPGNFREEGPFGDHTGLYSPPEPYPVFNLTCITHRIEPIYPATVVGRPPMEDCYFAKTTERLFLPLLKLIIPEMIDINLPIEGVFHNCAIVSIKKTYPGQARKVCHALWGIGQLMFTKVIIVVDEEVCVHNPSEVFWHVLNHIDPKRDLFFSEGPVDTLNHAASERNFGSKLGIDATRKLKEEGYPSPWPKKIEMTEEIKELVTKRWMEYEID